MGAENPAGLFVNLNASKKILGIIGGVENPIYTIYLFY